MIYDSIVKFEEGNYRFFFFEILLASQKTLMAQPNNGKVTTKVFIQHNCKLFHAIQHSEHFREHFFFLKWIKISIYFSIPTYFWAQVFQKAFFLTLKHQYTMY